MEHAAQAVEATVWSWWRGRQLCALQRLTAIFALREKRLDHARCIVLIEACEESGSKDLPYYLDDLTSRIGEPAVVIALDAGVSFRIDMISKGWHSHPIEPWLDEILEKSSLSEFGAPTAMIGGGSGYSVLGERFPKTQFMVIGVLGPQPNAHGPNEFLHIPTVKRITAVVAHIAHGVCQRRPPMPVADISDQRFELMKLLYQTHSPYARKALVFAHEAGIANDIEVIHQETNPILRNGGFSRRIH